MAVVICNRYCLVFIFRSSDLIQYGGIVTKANRERARTGGRHGEERRRKEKEGSGQGREGRTRMEGRRGAFRFSFGCEFITDCNKYCDFIHAHTQTRTVTTA